MLLTSYAGLFLAGGGGDARHDVGSGPAARVPAMRMLRTVMTERESNRDGSTIALARRANAGALALGGASNGEQRDEYRVARCALRAIV